MTTLKEKVINPRMGREITAVLAQSFSQENSYLTDEGVVELWNKLPAVPAHGLPLIRSDGNDIGLIYNFTFSGAERHNVIYVHAIITDSIIISNPGLSLEQIVRAAIRFMVGSTR